MAPIQRRNGLWYVKRADGWHCVGPSLEKAIEYAGRGLAM